jgi:hypothetical protein
VQSRTGSGITSYESNFQVCGRTGFVSGVVYTPGVCR